MTPTLPIVGIFHYRLSEVENVVATVRICPGFPNSPIGIYLFVNLDVIYKMFRDVAPPRSLPRYLIYLAMRDLQSPLCLIFNPGRVRSFPQI